MRTQPETNHCTCHTIYPKPSENPTRNAFGYIPVGAVFVYNGARVVKITNSYFNIYDSSSKYSKMVNAMVEVGGELLYIPSGLIVAYEY